MQDRNSLARYKKRRSQPTSGSAGGSGKPEVEAPPTKAEDRPPVAAGPAPTAPPPPGGGAAPPDEPPVSEAEKSEKERKLNMLFWMRVVLAVVAGTMATFIFADIEGEERRWASIAFMIIVFAGTVVVAKSMRMQLPSSDRKKIVTQALGSYVFLYLFTWIVTHTLANLESVQNGINL